MTDHVNATIGDVAAVGAYALLAGPLLWFMGRDLVDQLRGRELRPWRRRWRAGR